MVWLHPNSAGVTVAAGEQAYLLMLALEASGVWEHAASSDGTNVSNTVGNANRQITSVAEMNTNHAWWDYRQKTTNFGSWGRKGGRHIICRRGTTATSWLIVYVPLDTNEAEQTATAAGTTTTIPVYTTRFALVGTLPDTTAAFFTSSANARAVIGVQDIAPGGFFSGAWSNDGNTIGSCLFFDPLAPDTVDPEDEDPYVLAAFTTNAWLETGLSVPAGGPQCYWRKGLTGELFTSIGAGGIYIKRAGAEVRVLPRDIGRGPIGKFERTVPLHYMHGQTDGADVYSRCVQYKGDSTIYRWKMGAYVNGVRRSVYKDNDHVVLGDCLVPWNPSITPVWST